MIVSLSCVGKKRRELPWPAATGSREKAIAGRAGEEAALAARTGGDGKGAPRHSRFLVNRKLIGPRTCRRQLGNSGH